MQIGSSHASLTLVRPLQFAATPRDTSRDAAGGDSLAYPTKWDSPIGDHAISIIQADGKVSLNLIYGSHETIAHDDNREETVFHLTSFHGDWGKEALLQESLLPIGIAEISSGRGALLASLTNAKLRPILFGDMKRFLSAITSVFLATAAYGSTTLTYSVDSVTELSGNFEFDYIADSSLGGGTTIASFPHFHVSLNPPETYPPGSTYFEVQIGTNQTIDLRAVDISFPSVPTALQQYDTSSGVQASYPDFNGTFLSPFDGTTTIFYSYTDVGEISPGIFAGSFRFTSIPEPSVPMLIFASGLAYLGLSRKRPSSGR